jgi:hypothetical protein
MAANHYPDGLTPAVIAALQREVYDELKREGYPRPRRSGVEHESRRLGAAETATVGRRLVGPAVRDRVARHAVPDSGDDETAAPRIDAA